MNKPEFLVEYARLCKGFRFESTPEQSAAWYAKIGHLPVEDWREAVTTLLCNPRFPSLDPAMVACEQAGEQRRRTIAQRERMEAQQFFRGRIVYRKGDDPTEQAYNAMRMKLLYGAYIPDQPPRHYGQRNADGLADWIADKANAEWARNVQMGQCGYHDGPHTVLRCITDEMRYWTLRAQGYSEEDAKASVLGIEAEGNLVCALCSGENHDPGDCWPWHSEKERQRRFNLPYWRERMIARGIDPTKVLKNIKDQANV